MAVKCPRSHQRFTEPMTRLRDIPGFRRTKSEKHWFTYSELL